MVNEQLPNNKRFANLREFRKAIVGITGIKIYYSQLIKNSKKAWIKTGDTNEY